MIDLSVETPLTLREACALPQLQRNGRKPHLASMYRWVSRGCRGIRLESIVVAGSRCVTAEAVDRWIAQLTAPSSGDTPPLRTPQKRQRDHERADSALAEKGW